MNNSKKTLLIALFPVVITVYFIMQILVPTVKDYLSLRDKYAEAITSYKETHARIEELQNNKKLFSELNELNNNLADFEVQVPAEFEDEFFLSDLERFSGETSTKIISLDSKKEKELEIISQSEEKTKKSRKGKRSKKSDQSQMLPLSVWERPFEFKVEGRFAKTIAFIDLLENYQRKFIINGVSAKISKSDENNPNPKIELTVQGSIYKQTKNFIIQETENPAENAEEPEHS